MTKERKSGLTLLEVTLALTLLIIIAAKAHSTLKVAQQTHDRDTQRAVLENQANEVMQKIAFAILGANRETLIPETGRPISSSDLRFQVHLGLQDGEVVWSDPEQIALDDENSQLFWSENPGATNEQRVVWSNLVTPFLEGEIPNGIDDNGNQLIDEKGLSFVVDRNAVTIRLTVQRTNEDGEFVSETVETTVTCRNLEIAP